MNGVIGIQGNFFSFLDHVYLIGLSQDYAKGKSFICQLESAV